MLRIYDETERGDQPIVLRTEKGHSKDGKKNTKHISVGLVGKNGYSMNLHDTPKIKAGCENMMIIINFGHALF